MTDFELQRRLRDLNTARPPCDDLWPTIALRISAESAAPAQLHRRAARWPLAAAASLLIALGGVVYLTRPAPPTMVPRTATTAPAPRGTTLSPGEVAAFAQARGTDPRLAGATVELDAAHAELEQALEQRPDAAFLVGLLARTQARRLKLEHYGVRAG